MPRGNDAFPPVSDFPLFPKKISDSAENFPNLTFSKKNFVFHPPKFLTSFFSHSPQISNFPLFSVFQFISPYFRKFFFPPTTANFPLISINLRDFAYFTCISFPSALTMMHLCITQCTYWTPLCCSDDNA